MSTDVSYFCGADGHEHQGFDTSIGVIHADGRDNPLGYAMLDFGPDLSIGLSDDARREVIAKLSQA